MKALSNLSYVKRLGFCSLLILAILVTGCGGSGNAGGSDSSPESSSNRTGGSSSGGKQVFTMWGYWQPPQTLLDAFHEQYPDIDLNFVHTESVDMMQKLQVSLASGNKLPDLVMLERGFRGRANSLGIFEVLEDAPYNANIDAMFDYSPVTNVDGDGKLVSIPMDLGVAGLLYKRELAKTYFGTDDPEELEKMFPTWDALLEKGIEVKEQSGGKVFLFPSLWDLWSFLESQAQSKQLFVADAKLNKDQLRSTYEQLIKFRDAGVVDKLTEWSPAWNAAFAQDNHIFSIGPLWAPSYLLENNDPNGKDAGRWGLMTPPLGGVIMGGSSYAIPKGAENKEAAWKFVEFSNFTMEGTRLQKEVGTFNHFKAAYDDPEFIKWEHAWFGGQNIGEKYFKDLSPTVQDYYLTEFEAAIREANEVMLKMLNADPSLNVDGVMPKLVEILKEIDERIITD